MKGGARFLSAQQGSGDGTPAVSWWHVTVRLAWRPWCHSIPDATVHLRFTDHDGSNPSPEFQMRWRSKDVAAGVSAVTLRPRVTYFVPIVRRDLGTQHRQARLSHQNEMMGGGPTTTMRTGEYLLHLVVRSGASQWRTVNPYFLKIPAGGWDNGLMFLEERYEDQLPGRVWPT